MKGLLIDASMAANWLLHEDLNPVARETADRMHAGTPVFAPALWILEITNVLFNAERRKRIDRRHRDAALEQVERLPVGILPSPGLADLKMLRHYAEKHQLTSYDAEYLRAAKSGNLALATLDGNLASAARREKVGVLSV